MWLFISLFLSLFLFQAFSSVFLLYHFILALSILLFLASSFLSYFYIFLYYRVLFLVSFVRSFLRQFISYIFLLYLFLSDISVLGTNNTLLNINIILYHITITYDKLQTPHISTYSHLELCHEYTKTSDLKLNGLLWL
jgi:hypothetical protein